MARASCLVPEPRIWGKREQDEVLLLLDVRVLSGMPGRERGHLDASEFKRLPCCAGRTQSTCLGDKTGTARDKQQRRAARPSALELLPVRHAAVICDANEHDDCVLQQPHHTCSRGERQREPVPLRVEPWPVFTASTLDLCHL